jgi:hypothetical protein
MTGAPLGRAEVAEADLARARAAYRASLEALRGWRAISPSARHPDAACRCLLGALFAEPGLHRTALVGRIAECAGVSRSTAERVLRRARDGGHVVDRPAGKRVGYFLSERAFADCLAYFRAHMDRADGPGRPDGGGR